MKRQTPSGALSGGAGSIANKFFRGLFLIGLAAAVALAEEASPEKKSSGSSTPDPSSNDIRVKVQVVNVPVTVLDENGRPVYGLTQKDFEVYEDGKPQAIRYFSRETDLPLRVGVLLDTSNSSRRFLSFMKDAASEFCYTLLEKSRRHRIFLLTFDATPELAQDFTNDPEKLDSAIRKAQAGGGKVFYDAVYYACKEKILRAQATEGTRRVLVLVTDGRDVASTHSLEEVLSLARLAEVSIYAIDVTAYGFVNPADKVLKRIAEETGGEAFFPLQKSPGADLTGYTSHGQFEGTTQNKALSSGQGIYSTARYIQLVDSLDALGRQLREQYNIGYTPTHDDMDGTYRTIRVVAKRKGLTVRAKKGYFALAEAAKLEAAGRALPSQ